MELGYQRRSIERECTEFRPEFGDALSAVTWMIEHELMEFWLVTGYADGTECLYHEKIGVIEDVAGNFVTFEGSPNETFSGLGSNIESFPIHRSWIAGEAPHAFAAKEAVDQLFDPTGHRPLRVEPFPSALADGLVKTYIPRRPRRMKPRSRVAGSTTTTGDTSSMGLPAQPTWLDFRTYQAQAVRSWFKADGRGLLSMATGTGKTVTALGAVERLAQVYSEAPGLTVVVIVPDNSLVDMWKGELNEWGVRAVCSTRSSALGRLREELQGQRLNGGTTVAVWTAQSASNPKFLAALRDFPSPRLLIADECHALGSTENRKLLLDDFHYRLGLSATIDRHLDPEGTEVLRDYFGSQLLDIGIKEAIELGALCHYTYKPVLVPLSHEEMREYARLSQEIGKRVGSSSGLSIGDLEDSAKMLLIERARLLWHAEGKVAAFRESLESLPTTDRDLTLIYTAEGESPIAHVRQGPLIHAVGEELGLTYRDFFGDTPLDERSALLSQLAEHTIDGLVAMKCLDQGIDIPTARVAHFLASTRNPRQYVQRRGRVLRRPRDGSSKHALVFDYIAHPEPGGQNFEMERRLVAQELLRAREMAEAADNRYQAIDALRPLLDGYNLWDTLGEE
jgi:superfamily II DNA or RNA helicase